MKLREVYRYEMEHRVRSASTWAYGLILFLLAVWMYLATADGASSAALANAPERLAGAAVLPAMFGMLISAALFGDAALRDVQAGMDPLLYASPVGKHEYLGGRFLAALSVNAVLVVAIILGGIVATALVAASDPAAVGPFRASAYAQAYLLFLLPNVVLVGAIQYTIGSLTRQIVPVFLATIGIFIAYVVALNYASRIDSAVLASMIDPLGLVTLQEVTRYWTEAERNTRLVASPLLYVNRGIWLAVAAAVLGVLVARFRFAHPDGDGGGRRERVAAADEAPARVGPLAVPRVTGSFRARTRVRQTVAVARHSLAEFAASRWFMFVPVACVGLTLLWGWNVGSTVFDTESWPVTLLVAEVVQSQRVLPIIYLLIVVFAGELVWKEREVGVAEIADAAPVPEGVALVGRFLALVAILALIQLAVLVGGILIQALQGYYRFELGLYVTILFGLNFADYVLWAALAIAVHVVLNHKYLGHMVVLLILISTIALPGMRIVQHHLLLYATDPGWTYSDMNGFGPFLRPFVWFKLYWGAWALLFGVAAALFWVRGREAGVGARLRVARGRFRGGVARAAAVAAVLIVVFGGFVFYNTNVLNDYAPRERGRRQALYEQRYARFADAPQPMIESTQLHVEIYPDEPAVDIRGTYRLVNNTTAPIDTIHVAFYDDAIDVRAISVDGAEVVLIDDDAGYRVYALSRPLAPRDSIELSFDVAFRPRGFPNADIQTDVVANGAFFNRSWLPFIGYQPMFELTNEETRQRFGLAPRAPTPRPQEAIRLDQRQPFSDADLVHIDMTIGTDDDQIALTPGTLRRTWTERGRRYFHYVTDAPISFGGTIFSADYDVVEDRWNDVALRVFHHPAHGNDNVARMLQSTKASLDYFTEQFGPYPYRQLRIVENPRYGGFGHAHPETIGFTEDAFFARSRQDQFDQTFYGTAHEVAHTWWGGLVRGANGVRGSAILSESLANYSAMMVTEKTFGLEAARQVYDYQMNRYLVMRGRTGNDVPLLEVDNQPYIFYGKGAVAIYLLRDYIGEARVNAALRRFLEKHRAGVPPFPTSLDLYAELRAATPDSLHGLLTDLFETVTTWDLSTERATVESGENGGYVVTLEVVARKETEDSTGNAVEVPMNDLVQIGVFAAGDDGAFGETLYLERHRIRSGSQTIRVTVPRAPARAGIDPYRMLIDRERGDNVVAVSPAGGSP